MMFCKMCNISSFLFLLLIVCDISYGKTLKSKRLKSPLSSRSPRSLWDDLFSYFDDTSEEDDESIEELFDNSSNDRPESQSAQNRKYEFCRDCNISYHNINSTQHINYYNQVTTEKANGKPTPEATTMKKATKNGATTKDTTQTTVSPKAIITTTTTTTPTQTTFLTTTTPKSSNDVQVGVDSAATPTITTTTTTIVSTTTTKSVDMTTIPPAPVPLDEPLLEPSDNMPSEEALTSEENV